MQGWTDYPIAELGDPAGEIAPVRECEVVSYDGNKYVTVRVGGVQTSFKAGYLYRKEGRLSDQPGNFTEQELKTLKRNDSAGSDQDGWYSVTGRGTQGPYTSLRQAQIRSGNT